MGKIWPVRNKLKHEFNVLIAKEKWNTRHTFIVWVTCTKWIHQVRGKSQRTRFPQQMDRRRDKVKRIPKMSFARCCKYWQTRPWTKQLKFRSACDQMSSYSKRKQWWPRPVPSPFKFNGNSVLLSRLFHVFWADKVIAKSFCTWHENCAVVARMWKKCCNVKVSCHYDIDAHVRNIYD